MVGYPYSYGDELIPEEATKNLEKLGIFNVQGKFSAWADILGYGVSWDFSSWSCFLSNIVENGNALKNTFSSFNNPTS